MLLVFITNGVFDLEYFKTGVGVGVGEDKSLIYSQ